MIYTKLTQQAMRLAYAFHDGQKDKAGVPYIFHVAHVAEQMDDEYSTCVALLHDTLEDTDVTEENLRRLFPDEIVDAVVAMTHRRHESYESYIARIKENELAVKVKLADLQHNLDTTRLAGTGVDMTKKREKYLNAVRILSECNGQLSLSDYSA